MSAPPPDRDDPPPLDGSIPPDGSTSPDGSTPLDADDRLDVIVGPGTRLGALPALLGALGREAAAVDDLAELLDPTVRVQLAGAGTLVVDAARVPVEDHGLLRRFRTAHPAWRIHWIVDDARALRSLELAGVADGTAWTWPPDVEQLTALGAGHGRATESAAGAADRAAVGTAGSEDLLAGANRPPVLHRTGPYRTGPDRTGDRTSPAPMPLGPTHRDPEPRVVEAGRTDEELARIEAILAGARAEVEPLVEATRAWPAPDWTDERPGADRPTTARTRSGLGEGGVLEDEDLESGVAFADLDPVAAELEALLPALDDPLPRQGLRTDSITTPPPAEPPADPRDELDELDESPESALSNRPMGASDDLLEDVSWEDPGEDPFALDTAVEDLPPNITSDAERAARDEEPQHEPRGGPVRLGRGGSLQSTLAGGSRAPIPPWLKDQLADVADAVQRVQLAASAQAEEGLETAESPTGRLSELDAELLRLRQLVRTLRWVAAPPPAGDQEVDLGVLVEEQLGALAGRGPESPRFLFRRLGEPIARCDKMLVAMALDAALQTAASCARAGDVVRTTATGPESGDSDRTESLIRIDFPAGPLEAMQPVEVLEPYALRRVLPAIGSNALAAAGAICVGQGGDLDLAQLSGGRWQWTFRLPVRS